MFKGYVKGRNDKHIRGHPTEGQGEVQERPKHFTAALSSRRVPILSTALPIRAHPAPESSLHSRACQSVCSWRRSWKLPCLFREGERGLRAWTSQLHFHPLRSLGHVSCSCFLPPNCPCWLMLTQVVFSLFNQNALGKPRALGLAGKMLLDLCRLC